MAKLNGKSFQQAIKGSDYSVAEIAEKLGVTRQRLAQLYKLDEVPEFHVMKLRDLGILSRETKVVPELEMIENLNERMRYLEKRIDQQDELNRSLSRQVDLIARLVDAKNAHK